VTVKGREAGDPRREMTHERKEKAGWIGVLGGVIWPIYWFIRDIAADQC